MSDLLVVMTATKTHGLMETYIAQLSDAKIPYHVEKVEENDIQASLGWEISNFRRVMAKFPDVKTFIFTDAWDVLFYGTKEEILSKIPEFKVLLGAERNCYPDQTLANGINGLYPWKFANGGLVAGHRESLERWMSAMEASYIYRKDMCNQTYFNMELFLNQRIPNAILDYNTELFYCLHHEKGELGFDKGRPINQSISLRNKETYFWRESGECPRPNFIHFNGQWPSQPTMELRDKSLGIEKPPQALRKVIISLPVSIDVCEDCRDRILKEMMP